MHLLMQQLLSLPPLPSSVSLPTARYHTMSHTAADIQLALPVFIEEDSTNERLDTDPPILIIVKRPYSDRPLPPSPTL